MQSIRQSLRAATADVHQSLDAATADLDLAARDSYGQFLKAQSGPVTALEEALEAAGVSTFLPDWPRRSRRRALAEDLATLGLQPITLPPQRIASREEAFGILYVLEGSRLGARILVKRVLDHAPELASATRFLSHGASEKFWPAFLPLLEAAVPEAGLQLCIAGASRAFSLFEAAFVRSFALARTASA